MTRCESRSRDDLEGGVEETLRRLAGELVGAPPLRRLFGPDPGRPAPAACPCAGR